MKHPALLQIPEEHVLVAFAAMMLGSSPLDPPPEAAATAEMATRLAEPRPARRPGDVEGTRAFRTVYGIAVESAAEPRKNAADADRAGATKPSIVLASTLELRHRQRAALALRYVFGIPASGVARVLGLSQNRTAEVIRAASARVSTAAGGRVDVARHLRAIGAMVLANDPPAVETRAVEPRSVVKLLISAVAEAPAARGRAMTPIATAPARPVYHVRAGSRPASRPPAVPRMAERKPRRTGLLLAACVAALAFLGAFAPVALLRPAARFPLATVPIAGAVEEAVQAAPSVASPAVVYRVREGDTLWSIAGIVLGDAGRWRELWRSNAGRTMGDGSRFLDPDLIQPGWRLRLPPR